MYLSWQLDRHPSSHNLTAPVPMFACPLTGSAPLGTRVCPGELAGPLALPSYLFGGSPCQLPSVMYAEPP